LFVDSERYRLNSIGNTLGRELEFEAIDTVPDNGQELPRPAFVTLCIAGGRKQKIRPGDILGALTGDAGIDGKAVGKIDVLDYAAYVAIERDVANKAMSRLANGKIKGRRFRVRAL
jgi:ATP-independent RNA helicase DbpA